MPKHIQTQTEWEQTMARRVMEQLRGELYLDQRYLPAALGALPAAQTERGGSFATDGGALYYPAPGGLDTYRKNRRYLPRAYLHSLFHCIFRHLWLRDKRDPDLWGLACDIAVESALDALTTDADMILFGLTRESGGAVKPTDYLPAGFCPDLQALGSALSPLLFDTGLLAAPYPKLFRRAAIGAVRFDARLAINEDVLFNIHFLQNTSAI